MTPFQTRVIQNLSVSKKGQFLLRIRVLIGYFRGFLFGRGTKKDNFGIGPLKKVVFSDPNAKFNLTLALVDQFPQFKCVTPHFKGWPIHLTHFQNDW